MSGYIGPQPVPQATQTREAFTATSGQTTFNTGGYTAGYIDVFLNGVKLAAADYTATNGSDVVLATGAATGDILETVAYTAFTVADQGFTGTTTAEDLTVTGAFTSQGIDDNATSTAMTLDASGNVGIGTSSPTSNLSINAGAATGTHLDITTTGSGHNFDMVDSSGTARIRNVGGRLRIGADNDNVAADSWVQFDVDGTERMRITSDGEVGIGTSSPAEELHLAASLPTIRLEDTDNNYYAHVYSQNGDLILSSDQGNANSGSAMRFEVDTTEAMRIDSSGNVGIGASSPQSKLEMILNHTPVTRTTVATTFDGDGLYQYFTGLNDDAWGGKQVGGIYSRWKSGGTMNWCGIDFIDARTSSSGGHRSRIEFRTRNGGSGDRSVGTVNHVGTIHPSTDNVSDLGASSVRWDDIYATNSTIQTSDENEKQQIAALTDAEMTAAKAISKLFKTFKWNSAVEAKGDAARTHTGVIAQQVEQAMTDAGLDADDYAFFVRAVHYTDTVEGNDLVFDYDDDERTETATKHEKLAIRYPELLAFIGAATEQRLASIETRLDALEAN